MTSLYSITTTPATMTDLTTDQLFYNSNTQQNDDNNLNQVTFNISNAIPTNSNLPVPPNSAIFSHSGALVISSPPLLPSSSEKTVNVTLLKDVTKNQPSTTTTVSFSLTNLALHAISSVEVGDGEGVGKPYIYVQLCREGDDEMGLTEGEIEDLEDGDNDEEEDNEDEEDGNDSSASSKMIELYISKDELSSSSESSVEEERQVIQVVFEAMSAGCEACSTPGSNADMKSMMAMMLGMNNGEMTEYDDDDDNDDDDNDDNDDDDNYNETNSNPNIFKNETLPISEDSIPEPTISKEDMERMFTQGIEPKPVYYYSDGGEVSDDSSEGADEESREKMLNHLDGLITNPGQFDDA